MPKNKVAVVDKPVPRKGMAKVSPEAAMPLADVVEHPPEHQFDIHPVADMFPPMSPEQRAAFSCDIEQKGLLSPIITWQGQIIDGRHRYGICRELRLPYRTQEFKGDEAQLVGYVVSLNLHRRHLNEGQRAQVADRAAELLSTGGANLHLDSLNAAAKMLNVSRRSVASARKVRREGVDELGVALREGKASVSAAADVATLPPERQLEIVARGEKEIIAAATQIRAAREKKRRAERRCKLAKKAWSEPPPIDSLPHKYVVFYGDPAWPYDHSISGNRDVENHYPSMTLDEICALPVSSVAALDAVLFLWATSPMLADAMRVIEAWEFTYKTCAVWDKEVAGNGYWFRQQHELLLVAVRGNIMAAELPGRVPSVIRSRRGAHSVKPDVVYGIIEDMYPDLPYLELFARRPRPGWTAWGNEVDVVESKDQADEPAPSKILVVRKMPDGSEVPIGAGMKVIQ